MMQRRLKIKFQMDLRWPALVRPVIYQREDTTEPEFVLAAFGSAVTVGMHFGRSW